MKQGAQYFRSLVFLVLITSGLISCDVFDEGSPANSPLIERFAASPNPAPPDSAVVLRWDVSGAESVRIDPDVGVVSASGTEEVRPSATTFYKLSAQTGTTASTAMIEVVIEGSSPANPTPTPTPDGSTTPTPDGSTTPTPSTSVTPTPTPVPSTPTPGTTPKTVDCGTAPSETKGCGVSVTDRVALPAGECLQVTQVAVSRGCPIGFNVTRAISFRIQAATKAGSLSWRRGSQTADVVSPAGGAISPNGPTDVALEQTVLSQALEIEIVDSGRVLMRFSVAN
jgi:hypothetical protein